MKYADGPTTEQTMYIEAAPTEIWALVSDPGFPARQGRELQQARWDPDGPAPGLGARIIGTNKHPAVGEWTTTSHIVEWEDGVGFSWAVENPERPAAQWWFELEVDGTGTTLTQRVRLGPGPSGLTPAIEAMPDREDDIVARRLREHDTNMAANLEAVRRYFENR